MHGFEFKIEDPKQRLHVIQRLQQNGHPYFILHTCQRLEVYSCRDPEDPALPVAGHWRGQAAFERLARIAAGLESRIPGELEILGQVRTAYKLFLAQRLPDCCALHRCFQAALALARRARRESGIDRNLTSLAGIAARELLQRVATATPLAVIGAGDMAGRAARYLRKRGAHAVRIASRCPENAWLLASQVGGFHSGLDHLVDCLEDVGGVLCATAAPHPVLYPHHLASARSPLVIVDLAEPPDCDPATQHHPDVTYIGLDAIESQVQHNTAERQACALKAAAIIQAGAREYGC